MDRGTLYNLGLLIILVLVQVLVCNHIHIFNVAVPFIYIYVILRLPMNLSPNKLYTWAFLSGFVVDLFSDTPGVNSLSCTLLAFLKRPILYLYIPKDDRTKDIRPSLANLGYADYSKYVFTMSIIFCSLIFLIEYFSFEDVEHIVIMALSSGLLSFGLLLGIDSLMITRRD